MSALVVEGFKPSQWNFGVDGDVIRQITLSYLTSPESANGKTYQENLDDCFQICRDTPACGGVQVTIATS